MISTAIAQPRFTRADFEPLFQNGTSTMFEATNAEGATFNLGSASTGNTWDLSVFQYDSESVDRVFINPSMTPYVNLFPDATHAQTMESEEESYGYFLLNNDGWYSLGYATEVQGAPFVIQFTPYMPGVKFPMERGVKWTYKSDPVSPLEGYTQETEMDVEAISGGTLITAQGAYQALCVKTVTKLTVRFEVGGQVLSEGYTTSVDYMFMTKDGVSATVFIDTMDINSATPTLEDASITVDGNVSRASSPAPLQQFSLDAVWPNPAPAASSINVSWRQDKAAAVELTLYDMLGRAVRSVFSGYTHAGSHTVSVPSADIPAGMYILRSHSAGISGGVQRISIVR
jgi:hypothetical protein